LHEKAEVADERAAEYMLRIEELEREGSETL
jgi:hypothetical protein